MSTQQNANLGIPTAGPLKLSPQMQKLSSGSATGNPRNKCALKPGHSLMDWIRLGNSGCDLSGTKGAIVPVSKIELSKHSSQNDAWMAIRGKVYNVTRYMDFHPGGQEELMRGVGKDATKLFDEVHAWVNYEQLLKKCLIGPLRNVVTIDADVFKVANSEFRPPEKLSIVQNIIPRFDWIQNTSELRFYFYTKQFCNPGLILTRKGDKELLVRIFIENNCHQYEFELHDDIQWPPVFVKVASETGKIELNFKKVHTVLWQGYGSNNVSKAQQLDDSNYEFEIVEKKRFNHNSFALVLRSKQDLIFRVPVGFHVTISCCVEGQTVSRSYTPVPKKYSLTDNECLQDLYFLLKTYDDGLLAKHINDLAVGSSLNLSQSKGSLRLNKFLGHTRITLLAAGSGITPFFGLIDHLLARYSNKIEKLVLMFFNRTEEDIWCRSLLEDLSKSDERLQLINILSQPSSEWNGETGHISRDIMSSIKDQTSSNYATYVCVCGPPVFSNLAEQILNTIDFPQDAIHLISG